jgi:DNA-binding transcriptional ArsR family regulator
MKAKRKQPLNDAMIGVVTDIFGALSDPSRLRLLRAILDAGDPQTQGELIEATGLTQAGTSKHLATLVRAGLVVREPQGARVLYSPVEPLVSDICNLVCGHVTVQARRKYKELG